MKRLITFISLIVIIFVGYILIEKGFDSSAFPIASYKTIETKHEALTTKLANYDRINQDEYESAKSTLDSSIRVYKDSKNKNETILAELEDVLNNEDDTAESEEPVNDVIYSDQEVYKIDFLLVALGNYAEAEGVDADMKLSSSTVTDSTASMLEYFLADMNFQVSGQYINVANFISHIENDEKLSWEISDFNMESGSGGVNASFKVKNIPVDSKSYLATKNTDLNSENSDGTTTDATNTIDGNVVSNEAISNVVDNNTTNSTNTTNTTSNTVSNTVSNNTVN